MKLVAIDSFYDLKSLTEIMAKFSSPYNFISYPNIASKIDGAVSLNNVHDLIELAKENSFIFYRFLTQSRNEDFIRHLLCVAATHTTEGVVVIERSTDIHAYSIIRRIARSVGLALESEVVGNNVIFKLFASSDLRSQAYFDRHHLEKSLGFKVPNISPEEMLELAKEKLRSGQSFSFVRYNHCEPRVMGYGQFFSDEDLDVTFRIQWGETNIAAEDRVHLSSMMRRSLSVADVVGAPDFKKKIETKLHILENSFSMICSELRLLKDGVKFCHVNSHLRISNDKIFDLINEAENVFLITGRDVKERLETATAHPRIQQIAIPAEHKFGGDHNVISHYPARMEQVNQLISEISRPGTLFLIGGGILGKYYCALVKKYGGVALDIGSRFDAWAGVTTRGNGFSSTLGLLK